jgi:hypothetical protein
MLGQPSSDDYLALFVLLQERHLISMRKRGGLVEALSGLATT